MSYVIRNIRPSVIHIPDAGLRLESGQTAIIETLSPQMEELLAQRALEAISSDPDPPVASTPVDEDAIAADATAVAESPAPVDATSETPDATQLTTTVATVKKTRKSSATAASEPSDDAQ